MAHQPFDQHGNMLCLVCAKLIRRFYVVVGERTPVDSDPKLAVHIGCLDQLPLDGDEPEALLEDS